MAAGVTVTMILICVYQWESAFPNLPAPGINPNLKTKYKSRTQGRVSSDSSCRGLWLMAPLLIARMTSAHAK